ncbi:heme ABC exporter ATP-binding protein CcmA [uncultured Brevundimonas sp.]|uniref:heme ABC exporter ATP-binding protein CcmA n=1 Tax=uncultured Brevundimonas sp. TaxID=213418 RepID=UPI0026294509|nr:heme ABC exporter ATP-binding protein CcmA [uncultured Brevundimonas sp.]
MLDGLRIAELTLSRGERVLFQRLSLEVSRGQAVSLTGGNGAGKSTLLRAIAGFVRPDGGRIDFLNKGTEVEPEDARRSALHLTGHLEGLKPTRTACQEMTFQNRFLGGSEDGLAKAIDQLKLEPLLDLETRRLSAGQKRRVAMARLISAPRPLWLLDEPLAPLDSVWRQSMGDLMQAHLDGGGMIIAAVHDPLPFDTVSLDLGGRA